MSLTLSAAREAVSLYFEPLRTLFGERTVTNEHPSQPSEVMIEAERMSSIAMEFKHHRDALSREEALELLDIAGLEALTGRLSRGIRKRKVELETANDIAAGNVGPVVEHTETGTIRELTTWITSLSKLEQLILGLHFEQGLTMAEIRRYLEHEGIAKGDAAETNQEPRRGARFSTKK